MHALVCGAAPEPHAEAYYRSLLADADLVITADAASEWAAGLGRLPDVAVGDFDSAVPGAPDRLRDAGVEVVEYPAAKDLTDLDLALAEARARGVARVTFTAASSLRLDHTLAALGVLASAADLGGALAEPTVAAWAIDAACRPSIELGGPAGAIVSTFALSGEAQGVTLTGLRFRLYAATLAPLSGLGISNELVAERAVIGVTHGRLLVLSPGRPGARARLANLGEAPRAL